jgi:predicted nucleotidyltransferase
MSQALAISAERLGCSERTLRRYVNDGLLRGRRVGRGRLELLAAEERYLGDHWELLRALRLALRTEPAVRLAVLFGSSAVGEDDRDSDVDLLVVSRTPVPLAVAGMAMRLRRALDRQVDVVTMEQAEAMPSLLADALEEGRVLVDRDGLWPALRHRRGEIIVAAEAAESASAANARRTVTGARDRVAAAA